MTTRRKTPRPWPIAGALLSGLLGAVVLATAACSERAPQPATTVQHADMSTVLIPIEGMSCVSCAAQVTKKLESMSGVADAEVNLADRRARVLFAPTEVTVDQIVAAVDGLGYRAGAPSEVQ